MAASAAPTAVPTEAAPQGARVLGAVSCAEPPPDCPADIFYGSMTPRFTWWGVAVVDLPTPGRAEDASRTAAALQRVIPDVDLLDNLASGGWLVRFGLKNQCVAMGQLPEDVAAGTYHIMHPPLRAHILDTSTALHEAGLRCFLVTTSLPAMEMLHVPPFPFPHRQGASAAGKE